MWKKKLKKKKQQFLLIGMILMFSAAILAGCISFTVETAKSSGYYYKPENCPELFLLVSGENMQESILKDSDLMKPVGILYCQPAKIIVGEFLYEGKRLPKYGMAITALENYKEVPWYMDIVKRDKYIRSSVRPGDNEIWISSVYAKDNNIHVGDTVLINGSTKKELKVSAMFNAAVCPSGMMGVYPFYVNEATLDTLEDKPGTYMAFSLKDGSMTLEEFRNKLPGEIFNNIIYDLDRSGMELSFSTAGALFGGIGALAALVIFIVSVIVIRFLLKSTLIREYRSIGIYKSLGFTSKEIKYFYLKCYLMTGGFALPAGVLLGLPVSFILGSTTFRYMGSYRISYATLLLGVLTVILLLGILTMNVEWTLKSIKKITPVEAINIGMTSSKVKLKKSIIKNAYTPLSMAINYIFKRKGMSIMVMIILTVSFYLAIFFSCINYTCGNLDKHLDRWFGLPQSDCIIETAITQDIIAYLEQDEKVLSAGYADFNFHIRNMKCNDKGLDLSNSSVFAYNTFDETVLDFYYTDGRPPVNPCEIGVSDSQLKDIGLKAGDYINLTIGDHTGEYLICGSFSSWYRGGKNFHILNSELDRCHASHSNQTGFIRLKNKGSYEQFKQEFEAKFPKVQVNTMSPALKTATDSIMELASPITITLVGVFILFSLLNIINLLLMNNIENRRQYGILKALGFTNRYICIQNLYNIAILTCGAVILAQIIHHTASGALFYVFGGVNAMENPVWLNSIVTVLMVAFILLITLLFSLPLKKIVPADLMEE